MHHGLRVIHVLRCHCIFFKIVSCTFCIKVEESSGPTPLQSGHQHEAHTPAVNTQCRVDDAHMELRNTTLSGCTPEDGGRAAPPPPGHRPNHQRCTCSNHLAAPLTVGDDRDQPRATATGDQVQLTHATPASTATSRFPAALSTPCHRCRP
jgi:hypothetical protein